jgi:hypothetical protein
MTPPRPVTSPPALSLLPLVLAAALGCGSSDDGGSPSAPHRWDLLTAREGVIEGRLQDQDTGAAIAGATIVIAQGAATQRVLTRQDGSFAATAATGRASIAVESGTHVAVSRDVMVGETRVERTVRMARKGEPHDVSAAGGSFDAGAGHVDVPMDAFAAGARLVATTFDQPRLPALPGSVQFVGGLSASPFRILAALDLEASAPLARALALRLPLAAGVRQEAVRIFRASAGSWVLGGAAAIGAGQVSFTVSQPGTWAAVLDASAGLGGPPGYVLVEQGDAAVGKGGDFLAGGAIGSGIAAVTVADPWGSLVTTLPGGRVTLLPPAVAAGGADGGLPGGAGAPDAGAGGALAPYAGRLTATAGTTEIVVARASQGVAAGARMSVETPLGTFVTAGAAFTVTVCEQAGKPVVRLDVADGTVARADDQADAPIEAGHAALYCAGCTGDAAPICSPPGAPTDGGADLAPPLDAPPIDAATPTDAPATDAPVADVGPACGTNLLVNGGFEQPAIAANTDVYSTSPTFLPGWTLAAGPNGFFVENGQPFNQPRYHEGMQAVCLNGDGSPVAISQSFATIAGQTYTLGFAMTDEQGAGPSAAAVLVEVGDASTTFTRANDTGYVVKTLVFTARESLTTLKLTDVTPASASGNNPLIDEVSVTCGGDRGDGGAPDAPPLPGKAGYALAFDGRYGQHVAVADTDRLRLASFTYELWVNPEMTGNIAGLMTRPHGPADDDTAAIWFQSNTLYAGVNVANTAGALAYVWPPAMVGTWHHVAWTHDDATKAVALYIDGAMVASRTSPQGSPLYDAHPLVIGADMVGAQFTYGFQGRLDDVRIYGRARTQAEIAADGADAPRDADPDLVLRFTFDEAKGNVAFDSSGHQLDGTLGAVTGAAAPMPVWVVSTAPF